MSDTVIAEALSSDLSWRILDLLMDGESGELDVSEALGVRAASVRTLLGRLVEAGLVIGRRKTLPSGARSTVYSLAGSRSVGFPPRNYEYLSRALIKSLVESLGEESARIVLHDMAERMGEELGDSFLSQGDGKQLSPSRYADQFVMHLLAGMKIYPRVVSVGRGKVVYEERNCLFQELASELPGLVCDVLDEGMHEGLDRKLGVKTTRESCKGHGDPVCRFCVTWKNARR